MKTIFIIAVIMFAGAWVIRRYIVNVHYTLAVIIDSLKDVACQFWLHVEKLWKREKKIHDLDVTDDYYWRD
jgi:hypothetical protein